MPSRRAQRCTEAEDGILLDKECKPGPISMMRLCSPISVLCRTACSIASLLSRVSLSLCAAQDRRWQALWGTPCGRCARTARHARAAWQVRVSKGHRHRVVKVAPLVARHGILRAVDALDLHILRALHADRAGLVELLRVVLQDLHLSRISRSLSLPSGLPTSLWCSLLMAMFRVMICVISAMGFERLITVFRTSSNRFISPPYSGIARCRLCIARRSSFAARAQLSRKSSTLSVEEVARWPWQPEAHGLVIDAVHDILTEFDIYLR